MEYRIRAYPARSGKRFAAVAQWIEQRTPDPQVAGSTPVSRAAARKKQQKEMYSIGIDVIETERIKSAAERNPKFLSRIFTDGEIAYCDKRKKQKYQSYAARFAAKEAVKKALSPSIPWKQIEVARERGGKPKIVIGERYKLKWESFDLTVSLSHIKSLAIAIVVAVKNET